MMDSREQPTTTVAILGPDALVEDILARLLGDRGYDTRLLEAYPETGSVDGLLYDVEALLLAPGLDKGVRETFLAAIRRNPKMTGVPVLAVSEDLKEALLDQQAVNASWEVLFEVLVREMESALWLAKTTGEPPAAAAAG